MKGLLNGVRVLDLSRVLAGPYCSMILGDLGADVIKVERPGVGDETRHWGPPFAAPGESAYFLCVNRNKRSITINLKSPEGIRIIKDLARKSDVFLENFTPGTLEELGIGYEAIRAENPGIIFCSITGFGPDGPASNRAGYDLAVSAYGGLMGITGEQDGPPVKVGVAITDVATGISAQGAICAALYAREKTGRGQRIDLSLLETQVSALVNIASSYLVSGEIPRKWGAAHETIVPYQAFETSDKHVIVAVGNDRLWVKFCEVLGKPELAEDPRFSTNPLRVKNRAECVGILARIFTTRSRDEWVRLLNEYAIPCAPINTMDEVFKDPQVLHRKMLVEVDHPTAGKIRLTGIPVKYSNAGTAIRRPPPLLGEHTNEILREVLGFDDARIEGLKSSGII
ncbi:MAG TPA: CoA transferase [Acidobacteriota bacterium]|nr:CoA transferase [Acidobacteriota bacterium]